MLLDRQLSYAAMLAWCIALAVTACAVTTSWANPGGPVTSTPSAESRHAEGKAQDSPFDLRRTKYLLGDWGGLRGDLEQGGVRFKIKLMNHLMANIHGGQETKNGHDTAGSYEVDLFLDMRKLLGIDDATFWIRGKGTWGGDDSDFDKEKIGGLFKTNQDASSEEPIFVDKWHWQQFLFDRKLEIRIGRQEPVKDLFDTSKIMGHEDKYFLNRALVRNATVPPKKGLSVFARWSFTDWSYISAAAFDAHSRDRQTNFNTAFHDEDQYLFYGELGLRPKFSSPKGKLWGHYRVGTWYDPTPKQVWPRAASGGSTGRGAERFDSGDWGFYVGFDQMVWKENDCSDDKQGIAVAGRYGYARGEVNQIEHFWAVAMQYEGLIPTRDRDVVALGVAQGILADESRRVNPLADRETVYELYYAIKIAPWLIITPDFQYITNTGGDNDDPHTMVAGLRFKMSL